MKTGYETLIKELAGKELECDEALTKAIDEGLEKLEPGERELLQKRFGIGEHSVHTLKQLGEDLGVSRSTATRRVDAAIRKMRTSAIWNPIRDLLLQQQQ